MIRLATRRDDPFRPGNFAYGLVIHTSDKWMAGTDANVIFTLMGASGTASKNQGNAPDWHLDPITVESARYGTKLRAEFDCWIDSTAPFTRALTP